MNHCDDIKQYGHIFQDTLCSLGNGLGNTAKVTAFNNTPPRENIEKRILTPQNCFLCMLAITN